jgi:3-carboxy-cis,cis-muconate cycloisomerase
MRPSFSSSDPSPDRPSDRSSEPSSDPGSTAAATSGLFDAVLAHGAVLDATSDTAWLQAMLDAEAALVLALADAGAVPVELAKEVAARCRADLFDGVLLGRQAAEGGNPVIPLVDALAASVSSDAAEIVHRGATSQDILDTAMMLVARRSLDVIIADLGRGAAALIELARAHRCTPMPGRTLLQHAVPTTFGLTAAGWLLGVDTAVERLREVRDQTLAAQLGGAAGTLESFGALAPAVVVRFAARVGLAVPIAPWHTERSRVTELAGALGTAAGAVGKMAGDIVLLAQTDIGEVHERGAGRGGSSAMPHKRNPIAAISARASVIPVPGLVSTLLTCAQQHELQRAAGAWHAEWLTLTHLLRAVGSGAAWSRASIESLDVDVSRMRLNLDETAGLVLAERLATTLAPLLGRRTAGQVVTEACRRAAAERRPLLDVLTGDARVASVLDATKLGELLDPAQPADTATALVDRILDSRTTRMEG